MNVTVRLFIVMLWVTAMGCDPGTLKAEGEACYASSECDVGLTCNFGVSPPVCSTGQTRAPDAAPDASPAQPDATPGDAGPMPDAPTPDAPPPDAPPPDAPPPDAPPPDAPPPDAPPPDAVAADAAA